MIQLYCGDGKGKTTAAVGAAARAAGRGRKIIFAQFMKGQPTGELAVLSQLGGVTILRSSKAFPFFANMTEEQKQELAGLHNRMLDTILAALAEGRADFVVLDEATHACRFGLLDEEKLERILAYGKSLTTEIIVTGRDAPERLCEASDYISEIRCVRHPHTDGVKARLGIEL